jgi:hypothetical protein
MNFYYYIIIGVIILALLLYWLYSYLFPEKSKVSSKNYLKQTIKPIALDTLENPESNIYSIELWLYVNSLTDADKNYSGYWPYMDGDKDNVRFGPFPSGGNPNGFIFAYSNPANTAETTISLDLHANRTITFFNGRSYRNQKGDTIYLPSVKMKSFPLQRWVYIVINVNNGLIELYIDGKLVDSKNVPKNKINGINKNHSIVFGNVDAYIAGMNRDIETLDLETIEKNYRKGKTDLYD